MTDEPADLDRQTPVEHALAGGEPQRVGWFRFFFADERWEWSPQVERMHGYEPGTVHPTIDLVLSHKHSDDYGQVAATLEEIRRTAGAFSTRHRIVDTRGEVHHVVVVGDQIFDDAGDVIGGAHRRPTQSCGCSRSKSRRTSSIFPTTGCCLPGPSTTGCC